AKGVPAGRASSESKGARDPVGEEILRQEFFVPIARMGDAKPRRVGGIDRVRSLEDCLKPVGAGFGEIPSVDAGANEERGAQRFPVLKGSGDGQKATVHEGPPEAYSAAGPLDENRQVATVFQNRLIDLLRASADVGKACDQRDGLQELEDAVWAVEFDSQL